MSPLGLGVMGREREERAKVGLVALAINSQARTPFIGCLNVSRGTVSGLLQLPLSPSSCYRMIFNNITHDIHHVHCGFYLRTLYPTSGFSLCSIHLCSSNETLFLVTNWEHKNTLCWTHRLFSVSSALNWSLTHSPGPV